MDLQCFVNDTRHCPNCGAALVAGSRFCSRCGAAVTLAPIAPTRAPIATVEAPRARRPWWILGLPIAIVALGLAIWALLAGMPYRNPQSMPRVASAAPDTIGEGDSRQSTTVARIGEPEAPPAVPPAPAPVPTNTIATVAPPPAAATANVPMASASPEDHAISEDDAMARLRTYVAQFESVDTACINARSLGMRNAGYTADVTNHCAADPRPLGRWRVDALNGEIFRQSADGRYLRP